MDNIDWKIAIISNLNKFDKKIQSDLLLLKKQSTSNTINNDIAIINIDLYCTNYYLKKAQFFAIFLKNL